MLNSNVFNLFTSARYPEKQRTFPGKLRYKDENNTVKLCYITFEISYMIHTSEGKGPRPKFQDPRPKSQDPSPKLRIHNRTSQFVNRTS